MRKFIIFSPPYDENIGGVICLHKLVHLINESGNIAYLYPSFENLEISKKNFLIPVLKFGREIYRSFRRPFKVNKNFNTPIYTGSINDLKTDQWIVIYYEQVFGNPLNARNVVRWLLHQPGFHTGAVYYGFNELHVRFNEAILPFHYPNSQLADFLLPIIHYPLEFYNSKNASTDRHGTAYCLRKGKGKLIQHELQESILIDDLAHEEIAKLFKKVKTFITYDSYTAYSRFASMCGCDSVVIPDSGVTEEQWYPNPLDRFGVAYGFDNIEKARTTRDLLCQKIDSEHNQTASLVVNFVKESQVFFKRTRYSQFRNKHVRKYTT